MFIGDLIWVLIVTLILGTVISIAFGRPGRRGGLIYLIIILFLATWAGGLWITPLGRPLWGVSWLSFLLVGIAVALLLTAMTPDYRRRRKLNHNTGLSEEEIPVAVDAFFWVLVGLLILTIVFAYL